MTKLKYTTFLSLLFTNCPHGWRKNDCCLSHLRATMSKQAFNEYINGLSEEVLHAYILRHKKCHEERKKNMV